MNANEKRREFLRDSLLIAGAVPVAMVDTIVRGSPEMALQPSTIPELSTVRIGILGCGRCGLQLAKAALGYSPDCVQIVGLADVFPDRIQQFYRSINGQFPDRVLLDARRRWVGVEAARGLAGSDADLIVISAASGFRTEHARQMIQAGKHVYAEMPVAAEPSAVEAFAALTDLAKNHGVGFSLGLPHRYRSSDNEMMVRLHSGVIGRPLLARLEARLPSATRTGPPNAIPPTRPKGMTAEEYRIRNWRTDARLAGSQLVEELSCSLDRMNWVMQSPPSEAVVADEELLSSEKRGLNSTLNSRSQKIEYTYPGGGRLECRIVTRPGQARYLSLKVQFSAGWCDLTANQIFDSTNQLIWSHEQHSSDSASGLLWLLSVLTQNRGGADSIPIPVDSRLAAQATLAAMRAGRA